MSSDSIFSLKGVTKSLGGKQILRNIDLEVDQGDFFVITGPSGSGKSTLLRLLNGLASQDEGNLHYRGNTIQNGSIQNLRKDVGMVFQNPVVLAETVQENLLVRKQWDKSFTVPDEQLLSLLDMVGIPKDHLQLDARSLSGGEKQRIALARTMLNEPRVLLLDEPTANLDQQLTGHILDMVNNLQNSKELTIVMVCHNIRQVKKYATKAAYLIAGSIAEAGNASILMKPESSAARSFLEKDE